MSKFIVFEGGEAAGKSTQAALAAKALGAILTRAPGGTTAGMKVREMLLSPDTGDLAGKTEVLMMAADRAQHVQEVIRPALNRGQHVVCDRFHGSTIAYQAYGRGMDATEVGSVCRWAADGCEPDLNILIHVPSEVAESRLVSRNEKLDRFEQEQQDFHTRVLNGFDRQAAENPKTWAVVDGVGSIESIAERVRVVLRERLGLL